MTGLLVLVWACRPEPTQEVWSTTPYALHVPSSLPAMPIPASNRLTVQGVALGRKLFFDPILSGDNTQACGDCHLAQFAFGNNTALSLGIDSLPGTRNAMPLFNLAWQPGFFWDGGAADIESQVVGPIQNPVEMHESLDHALAELKADAHYPDLFYAAFGTRTITIPLVMKAVAQFERTLVSGNAKYDRVMLGLESFSAQEQQGLDVYVSMSKGDCNHCHVLGSTFSDFVYRNTGLDSIPVDEGRFRITLLESDKGKFKTPSLRNITLTAPYMHDGRFTTLMQCIEHYNTQFHYAPNLDPMLASLPKGRMTQAEMQALEAFLQTLTDTEFISNPAFQKPQ